ncbi:PadR family transcriptional regulator [Kutzneria kofuensis]|uniref:DNA-binding PadR family transcriptional regulator n=1 Tax=Kutzneria kofuensis TaxID=103725 RepID=A0A7W9KAL1_9PSEU|nr:PadR family transcriptional regulator [Kutzneria kofuensis]MBB5888961.1 DNA-binding PadR family transcriptional regulator [Kutzneria kofuensis]
MSLRHALLGLLTLSPNSGYQLAQIFQNTLRQIWNARNHQLYPELARLSADGHVECVEEGARGKRTYAITDEGRAELRRWLVEVEPDRTMRSETYLRAWLLSAVLSREDALGVLERDIQVLREQRDGVLAVMARSAAISPPHGPHNLSLDLNLRLTEAMLGWSEEATRRIAERP